MKKYNKTFVHGLFLFFQLQISIKHSKKLEKFDFKMKLILEVAKYLGCFSKNINVLKGLDEHILTFQMLPILKVLF